jgi:flagellar hook-associated protein 3 FlgL
MTTIGKSMFPLKSSYQLLSSMKARYDQLQGQLSTGNRHANLAEMGSDRFFDLTMRARLSRFESYSNTMTTVQLRLDVLDQSISRLDTIEADQRTAAVPGGYGSANLSLGTLPTTSRARLDEVLDILNADVAGRYVFSGGKTDQRPVPSSTEVLDGVDGKAGFKTVVQQRKLADAGADGMGRLDLTRTGGLVELTEDGLAAHPFGLKLSTLSSSSTAIGLTQPAGTPQELGVQFNATLPAAGSTVTMGFTLPDGSSESITLTAVAAGETAVGRQFALGEATAGTVTATAASVATAAGTLTINGEDFAIGIGDDADDVMALINANPLAGVTATVGTGADAGKLILTGTTPTDGVDVTATVAGLGIAVGNSPASTAEENTAQNFEAALQVAIEDLVATDVNAASTYAAADNFFNGQGEQVMRVDGPPYETATGLVAATTVDTVMWYTGESSTDPRGSVNAKVDDSTTVRYGVQGNESGIVELVRSLAVVAAEIYPNGDETSHERFDAMATRQLKRLSEDHNNTTGSLEAISVELSLAEITMGNVRERQTDYGAKLETMLAEIENVSIEEVSMEILALKTRLEASYAATSLVAQLSLVNYLP